MSGIFTPTNQIRLTNVAIVRMKKCGKRFEIACYKNKVVSWRNKVEKDLDEVLQTHTVFVNVSKGEVARKEDLIKAFESDNQTEICKIILEKGELQISDKERQLQIENSFKEIALIISEKCINPTNRLPYPMTMIMKSMKQVHFSVKLNKSNKKQALELIKKLKDVIPIERAQMKFRIVTHKKNRKQLTELATSGFETDNQLDDGMFECIFVTDPGNYRVLDQLVKTTPNSQLNLLSLKEVDEVEETF